MTHTIHAQYRVVADNERDEYGLPRWLSFEPFAVLRLLGREPTWFGWGKLREQWLCVGGAKTLPEAEDAIRDDLKSLAKDLRIKLRQARDAETYYTGSISLDIEDIEEPAVEKTTWSSVA